MQCNAHQATGAERKKDDGGGKSNVKVGSVKKNELIPLQRCACGYLRAEMIQVSLRHFVLFVCFLLFFRSRLVPAFFMGVF